MIFANIVLFIFEILIGLLSMAILNNLHIQGAYRDSIVPMTKFIYHNPWLFLVPVSYGLATTLYIRYNKVDKNAAVLHITRIAVSVIFIVVITLIAMLPFVKLYGLLGLPANA